MSFADLPATVLTHLALAAARARAIGAKPVFTTTNRVETACLVLGLGGMALALGVTVAQATLPQVLETEAALRRAVVEAGFDARICPDGWAADHAAILPLTEAEVTAWYLRDAMVLSDADVIASVGLYVTRASDFRELEGAALTRNQILLCIAESRRLVTPLHDRIPPELRGDIDAV